MEATNMYIKPVMEFMCISSAKYIEYADKTFVC